MPPYLFNRLALALGGCLLVSSSLAAQEWKTPFSANTPKLLEEATTAAEAHPDASAIWLLDEQRYSVQPDNRVEVTTRRVVYVRDDEAAEDYGSIQWRWSPWYQDEPKLRAVVHGPDGLPTRLDPKAITSAPTKSSSDNIYEDDQEIRAPFPRLVPGSVLEYEIKVTDHSPFFAGGRTFSHFIGSTWAPTLETRTVIDLPEPHPFRYLIDLAPEIRVAPSSANGRSVWTFEHPTCGVVASAEANTPGSQPRYPAVHFTTAESWRAVAEGYRSLLSTIEIDRSRLEEIVGRVTTPEMTRREKIAALYRWVQDTVKYTGLSLAQNSIVPRAPAACVDTAYGDCKDQAFLLVQLLAVAEVPAQLALLDSGNDLDARPELPGMAFDHAIVYVPGEEEFWIDVTSDTCLLGELPAMDQGRFALVIASNVDGLRRLPRATADLNWVVERRTYRATPAGGSARELGEYHGRQRRSLGTFEGEQSTVVDNLADYLQSVYKCSKEAVTDVTWTNSDTLGTPTRLDIEMAECQRSVLDYKSAVVYVYYAGIFNSIPERIRKVDQVAGRESDWIFDDPYRATIEATVEVPAGYVTEEKVATLEERWGGATWRESFSIESPTQHRLTFELVIDKPIWTAEECREFAQKITEKSEGGLGKLLSFHQAVERHLTERQLQSALATTRQLAVEDPDSAGLHLGREARALLAIGLGEAARRKIDDALERDPGSAQLHHWAGEVYEHNQYGRRRGIGCDRERALHHYRRATELDPDSGYFAAAVAITLEFDERGNRYRSREDLVAAADIYEQLLDDSSVTIKYNYLQVLARASLGERLIATCDKLPRDLTVDVYRVVGVALTEGADAAIRQARELSETLERRNRLMLEASGILEKVREYPRAKTLMVEVAKTTPDRAAVQRAVEILEGLTITTPDTNTPVGVLTECLRRLSYFESKKRILDLYPPEHRAGLTEDPDFAELLAVEGIRWSDDNPDRGVDRIHQNFGQSAIAENGPDARRLIWETGRRRFMHEFTVRRGDRWYLLLRNSASGPAYEAFRALSTAEPDSSTIEIATRWLEWAYGLTDRTAVPGNPLQPAPLARLWGELSKGEVDGLRLLAALGASRHPESRSYLRQRLEQAPSDTERAAILQALVEGALPSDSESVTYADQLAAIEPESVWFRMLQVQRLSLAKRIDDAAAAIDAARPQNPVERNALAFLRGCVLPVRGRHAEAVATIEALFEEGLGDPVLQNQAAWSACYLSDPALLTKARTWAGNAVESRPNQPGTAHTAAMVCAELGHVTDALQYLNISVRYGTDLEIENELILARLAEAHGELDEAKRLYQRVAAEGGGPASSSALAELGLERIQARSDSEGDGPATTPDSASSDRR